MTPKLTDLNISKNQSAQWQQMPVRLRRRAVQRIGRGMGADATPKMFTVWATVPTTAVDRFSVGKMPKNAYISVVWKWWAVQGLNL